MKEPSTSDKVGPDIFPFGDESSVESDNLADAEGLTQKIIEDLEAALEQFREIAANLDSDAARDTALKPSSTL
jgi:type I restriction enzyme M protein